MTRRLLIALLSGACVVGVGVVVSSRLADDALGYSREFARRFAGVETGMPRVRVLELLGPPTGAGPEFHLMQREGYEAEYETAAASGAKQFVYWRNGTDSACAVGFDAEDRVVVAECGRS